jgi:hypothetical protein
MPLTFNPAAGLTANRVPAATGAGRFFDSPLSVSGSRVDFAEAGFRIVGASSNWGNYVTGDQFRISRVGVGDFVCVANSGVTLFGTGTESSNGRIQLASHSAIAGGLAFGSLATGQETIWRHAAGVLRTDASLRVPLLVDSLGFKLVGLQRPFDWKLPSGARSRATFDPASVTLPALAERVAALIYDLHRDGAYTATGHGHGLLLDANY